MTTFASAMNECGVEVEDPREEPSSPVYYQSAVDVAMVTCLLRARTEWSVTVVEEGEDIMRALRSEVARFETAPVLFCDSRSYYLVNQRIFEQAAIVHSVVQVGRAGVLPTRAEIVTDSEMLRYAKPLFMLVEDGALSIRLSDPPEASLRTGARVSVVTFPGVFAWPQMRPRDHTKAEADPLSAGPEE